jgi:hypothetical protein
MIRCVFRLATRPWKIISLHKLMAFQLVDMCHAASINRSFIPCSPLPGTSPHSYIDDSDHIVVYVKSPPSTP